MSSETSGVPEVGDSVKFTALQDTMMTLWNVQGCIRLLVVNDMMGDLPDEISALLRTILADVDATVAKIEPVM